MGFAARLDGKWIELEQVPQVFEASNANQTGDFEMDLTDFSSEFCSASFYCEQHGIPLPWLLRRLAAGTIGIQAVPEPIAEVSAMTRASGGAVYRRADLDSWLETPAGQDWRAASGKVLAMSHAKSRRKWLPFEKLDLDPAAAVKRTVL